MYEKIIINTDGGSRGNPGPAAAAFVLTTPSGRVLQQKAFLIGKATNNVAEYTAVIKALEAAKQLDVAGVLVKSDSELIVKQVLGSYKVKSDLIKPLYARTMELLSRFKSWQIEHVGREKNSEADDLVNQALDLGRDIDKTPNPNQKTIRLGILISGGGTTMVNIGDYIRKGKLNAEIAVVISSRSKVKGVERARNAGLEPKIIRKKDFPDIDELSKEIRKELLAAKVDLVIQAGWLCLWKIPEEFKTSVMNIHPALLPSFGGQGMWGRHVHEAVLKSGCKISGCTVHFCTNEYDKGPIIVQRSCPVMEDDTPNTLAARVFEQECIAYPEAISRFAEGKLKEQKKRIK